MSIGHTAPGVTPSTVEIAAGSSFTLLVALAAASRMPRHGQEPGLAAALDAVGDTEGETWLNLLGVPLDTRAPYDAERLPGVLAALDSVELRRHVLGRFAWSWCTIAGADDIDAAAGGDPAASSRLLGLPRYYGGHAADSLTVLLALDPDETKQRLLRAVEVGIRTLLDSHAHLPAEIAEHEAAGAIAAYPPVLAIERLTRGFRYVPEPEAERVVLIPHAEASLPLVLAQHRSARLIAYYAPEDRGREERLVALGRALADPKRVEILALVGRGVGRASDLVDETGLSRSTVHHHLMQLRETGLIALEGNARAYTYVPRRDAAVEVADLVADVIGT